MNRRGTAVPLLLTALGLGGMRSPAGERVDLSDIRNTGKGSWAKLIGDPDQPDIARRHVVDGVKRLRSLDLVHLSAPTSRNAGFSGWGLMSEDGSGLDYRVPAEGFALPVEFWTKAWVQVLTPPEILAYLMVRHMAARHPTAHSEIGVGAAPAVRRQQYGVTKSTYAALNELEEFGLIRRATPRQSGSVDETSPREVDRFQIIHGGLGVDALAKATAVFSSHPTPLRVSRFDPDDALFRAFMR